jgi:hypothetical protein
VAALAAYIRDLGLAMCTVAYCVCVVRSSPTALYVLTVGRSGVWGRGGGYAALFTKHDLRFPSSEVRAIMQGIDRMFAVYV